MIGHHQQALEMVALIPDRTSRDDMKMLGKRIELSQQDEIKMMQEWLSGRGQTLPAMALAWTLRDTRMTSTLVGVSSVEQLEANVRALERLDFTDEELAEINRYATESDINIWQPATET